MLLAIDVGNTNMVFGIYEGDWLVSSFRLKTDASRTADEIGLLATRYFAQFGLDANGVEDGDSFAPGAPCTRAMAMEFIWRALGCPEAAVSDNPFIDVAQDAVYRDAVLWALGEGVTSGVSDTTFGSDNTCTRSQIVTFLYQAFA